MPEHAEHREGDELHIAVEKLNRFMALENFAVRYMNEGEYRHILKNGIQPGREMNLQTLERFERERLLTGDFQTHNWISRIAHDTNWKILLKELLFTEEFFHNLKKARINEDGIRQSRKEIMRKLSQLLNKIHPRKLAQISLQAQNEIWEFAKDPDSYDRSHLRSMFNRSTRTISENRDEDLAPYHIMCVFDPSVLDMNLNSWGNKNWKLTRSDPQPNSLIAAFSLLSQKEACAELIELSSHAGEMAHPIFDSKGILRWPKND